MMTTFFRLNLGSHEEIFKKLGVDAKGDVQQHYTQNIFNRITGYMPKRTGILIGNTRIHSSTKIVTPGDHVRYLYLGKVMVDPKINAAGFQLKNGEWRSRKGSVKVATNRDLVYTTEHNANAGPYWDRRLKAAEGRKIIADTQAYIDRKVVKV